MPSRQQVQQARQQVQQARQQLQQAQQQQQEVQQAQQQQLPMPPTRWCPTPEQLMILEEMYRGGLRTPNSSQIQQITAHLASYGRIEGKNVFYWFQNHKARDRQRLRRRLCMSQHLLTCAQYYAAAAHHGHGHGFLGAAPTTTMPVASAAAAAAYGCSGGGGVYDAQLLSPTSPTPAAAAAYGYYYPATAFAAAPRAGRRCAGGATTPPSPNQQLFSYHRQGEGGGVVALAEPLGRPEHSLGKLDNFGVAADAAAVSAAAVDMVGPPGFEVAAPAFCRPLKTLDLFPGGLLKEEQHDVA